MLSVPSLRVAHIAYVRICSGASRAVARLADSTKTPPCFHATVVGPPYRERHGAIVMRRSCNNVMNVDSVRRITRGVVWLSMTLLWGCEGLVVHDTASLLVPRFQRSEVLGFVAGFGTTFAAVPDLIAMLKRRSSKCMNPTMAGIMGVFQIAWVYYGLLIQSRPVVAWNTIAVVINFLSVGAYLGFARRGR